MYIKSIVLDGFKSYGNRVEVTGFDPEFNAITGLNGTGKSNILDSICFVLGITNLSNVRAASLQELIYKHGQAGITKATVSITFDNRNKRQSPIGYENQDEITVTRQVVMGGKNKYLINGINVQNKRVNDLFCSVQLNVNNPHFLIMQGRITKVLNMKPAEVLSMVEEAAGTRMYESKKQVALKTIEKKDAKLRELNDIIREDIAPKLQKLQDERAQFQEYQKVVRELENLTRLYVAYKYVTLEKNAKEAENKLTAAQDDIKAKEDIMKDSEIKAKELDKEVAELNARLDEESGSALKELQTEEAALEKAETSAASELAGASEALSQHHKRVGLLRLALADDEAALQAKQAALGQMSSSFAELQAASEASKATLDEAQDKFLSVSTGHQGTTKSLQDQLLAAKALASELRDRINDNTLQKKPIELTLKNLERQLSGTSEQHHSDQEALAQLQAEIDKLTAELARVKFDPARYEELSATVNTRALQARDLRDRLDVASARLQRCNFNYTPPERGFDSSRVSGTICRLFDVSDSRYCTALETAAGGRLYNVVVDTEVTSKLLLTRGQLQSRTTLVPLNKISGHVIDQPTVRRAQEIGGGPENVQLALDLVSFAPYVRPAMAWVFGSTLVCRDLDTAKRVTFHPRVLRRSVTLEGDVFDPAGTLAGGAAVKGGSVLLELTELRRQEEQLRALEELLARDRALLAAMKSDADKYNALRNRYDMKLPELDVVKKRLAQAGTAQLQDNVRELRAQVTEMNEAIERDKAAQKENAARIREMEDKVKDVKGHRDKEFKKALDALEKAKKDVAFHGAAWRQTEGDFNTLKLEVTDLGKNVVASRAHIDDVSRAVDELQKNLDAAKRGRDRALEAVKDVRARIEAKREDIASRSSAVGALLRRRDAHVGAGNAAELALKELSFSVRELTAQAADCASKIAALAAEHLWIAGERAYFGAAGGLYDFGARQAHAAGGRLAQMRERRDKLARGLNARAHTLLGKEEEQYQDVMRKKAIVEADRAKLVQVMAELDEKKKRTLVAACEQVNRDFGSIFSTLLPGAQARLTPPDRLTVLDGLEVKVGFNNTWKESLGELSGGQRSLVALSLVLAMLLFKPAPLYILDEVDAALDLSHTQNIGHMLKEHFRHSQFIIVSLKDGMFNNANVLFRTRFVDGMSAVQRTINVRR